MVNFQVRKACMQSTLVRWHELLELHLSMSPQLIPVSWQVKLLMCIRMANFQEPAQPLKEQLP